MTTAYFRTVLSILTLLFIFSNSAFAQSFSGNVNSSGSSLGYANVNVFKGDSLVASLITDAAGNFSVKLDPGTYTYEVEYLGHKKESGTIEVVGDEVKDVAMVEDESEDEVTVLRSLAVRGATAGSSGGKSKKVSFMGSRSDGDVVYHYDAIEEVSDAEEYGYYDGAPAMKEMKAPGSIGPAIIGAEAGKLTAGEVNDFSKWDLWEDIRDDELGIYKAAWDLNLTGRYTVQVMNNQGLPLADAVVSLLQFSEIVYVARTDNTGKAELWSGISNAKEAVQDRLRIEVRYKEEIEVIRTPIHISQGVNSLQLEVDCGQSNQVDVAFVVDATGSMGDELEFLKAELNEIMFQSKSIDNKLTFRFGNVFYKDETDDYVTSLLDFTPVLSRSAGFIDLHGAGGGGDYEEAVEIALDSAINGLSWSAEARARIMFLVLDAPPHNNLIIREKLQRLSTQAAAKGIRIVPLVASGIDKSSEYLFRSMALATNGTYAFLTGHSGIGNEHMEPSTDSYKVEILSDLLKRLMVSFTYMPDCNMKIPDLPWVIPSDSITAELPADADSSGNDQSDSSASETLSVSWKYYPNPTSGKVYVEASVPIKELHLTDLNGKLLQRLTDIHPESQVVFDLSQYANGIYLLRYPVGKQWVSGKVLLVR